MQMPSTLPIPDRYNKLLCGVSRQLEDLKKAVKGLVVVTPEVEEISQALLQGKVTKRSRPAYSCLMNWCATTSELVLKNLFLNLSINTPPQHLHNCH